LRFAGLTARERAHRPEHVRAEMELAGYALARTHDFLPKNYSLVLEPGLRWARSFASQKR
jgi:hypothetical protein